MEEPTHSEDPMPRASSSSTSPHSDGYEGGTKTTRGIDYDVFLSFRERDTGKGFSDYLYTSLTDAGLRVFRDNDELRVGDEIGPDLVRAITRSRLSIPIISENYASSKWCLHELVLMLKGRRSEGQIVLPIFYKVNPSDVRNCEGRFGDAFQLCRHRMDEMDVKESKEALHEVSFLQGWEIVNRYEGALVKIVVRRVMSELKRFSQLDVPEHLVGMDDRVEEIMSVIDGESDGTRIVGIFGMGGIGKTTLAKVIFSTLSSRFEHCSFVANIQEMSQRMGIERVQKQLICDILRGPYDVSTVDEGIGVFKSQFTSKKVLICLDDVHDNTHLGALVNGSWFEAGSIIIITTRDKRILVEVGASHIFELNELPPDQSLMLFCRYAFRKDSPPSDYDAISLALVSTIGGLPLALEIIGSFLHGKRGEVWKDMLKKLEKMPHNIVREQLQISYDALDHEEQQIFLDIACFFNGSSQQSPIYMWDACDFFPRSAIEILSYMSLIRINEDGNLMMHNQLRNLGREIVRRENLKEPQKRSRLWIHEEAIDVLDNNKGTSKIEALRLDKYGCGRTYTGEQFKELTNLRFLQMRGENLVGDFQNLLPQLRWLQWEGCPSGFAMANFHPKKLVVLELSGSEISEDWGGWGPLKMAIELKVLNLSHCQSLRTTPDLSAFKSLEILILANCWNLEEIHPSVGDIKTLVSLNATRCSKLKELPAGVGRMEELNELILDETSIQEIPISRGCMMKLETLSASYCELVQLPESMGSLMSLTKLDLSHSRIEELPKSMGSLKSLTQLDLSNSWIDELPESMGSLVSLTQLDLSHSRIEDLPESMGSLVSLTQLNLSHSRIEGLPKSMGSLVRLTQLDLSHSRIEELPESMGSLVSLTQLDLSHLRIEELPESIGFLKELKTLDASNCESLARIPKSIGHLASLKCFLLRECCSLREIPDSIGTLASLIKLDLKSTMIAELPETVGCLKELEILDASYCLLLARIPNSIGHLASLSLLDLRFCRHLAQLPDSIGSLVSLQRLLLQECRLLREIPDSIGKLASLIELDLTHTAIAELPESIGSLKELETLNASYCASLTRIPSSIGHLASLSLLDLRFCRKLGQLPDSIGSLISLRRLLLGECRSLRDIPDSVGNLALLTELDLKRTAIVELPESIGNLQKLRISDNRGTQATELPSVIRMLQIAKI